MAKKKNLEIKGSAFESNTFDPRWLMAFSSLSEFTEFMNEKINDGEQISAGKSPTDKSKEEKEEEQPAEEQPSGDPAVAGAVEPVAPTPPIIDPSQAPGSQIAIGKKTVKDNVKSSSTRIKVGKQKKEKVNVKPSISSDILTGNGVRTFQ